MSNQMKIGIICPIGNLEKFGYHQISDIVLQSFCSFADRVVLISSSRDAHVAVNDPKIQLVLSPETWFDLDESGNELYTIDKLRANSNLGLDILAEDNLDIALMVHINQYIPETKFESIQRYMQEFLKSDKPFTWLYKMYQCGSQLFDADTRLPWIFNLHHRNRYETAPDSTLYFRNWLLWHSTKNVTIKTSKFRAFNNISIVDVLGEFTEKECEALWTFVGDRGGYNKMPGWLENEIYNHKIYLDYMLYKLRLKHPSSEGLDTFGIAIGERREPDFVCNELLRRLKL